MLLAPSVTLAHRPKDKSLVKKAAEAAVKQYKDISGREVKLEYDGSLPDDSAGGVVGSTMGGKIKVDNTLDERLQILQEKVRTAGALLHNSRDDVLMAQMLPELRTDLFGRNENRKFYTVSAGSIIWFCVC